MLTQTSIDSRTRERILRGAFAGALPSLRRVSVLELEQEPVHVRTTWCRAHPRCAFSIDIPVQRARELLACARICGFDVQLPQKPGHPMAEGSLASIQHFLRAWLNFQVDLLCEISQLVLDILASPGSRPVREMDMVFSHNPSAYPKMKVLHTVAALCLGESCQEIRTLVEIQREVYRSSGSAVRSLVAAATPHLAVATALELMSRS